MIYFGYQIKSKTDEIFEVLDNEKVLFIGDFAECTYYVQRLVLKR